MSVLKRSLFLLLVLQPWGVVGAQVITGSLRGTVMDESGAPLTGVAVKLTSPALLGGVSTGETNNNGQFRFLALEPGVYQIEISVDGFASYREEGIRIQVGGTVERNVELKLEAVAEVITVRGESPLIDAREPGIDTNYDSVAIRRTPVPRAGVYDLIKSAPGVSATSPTSRTQRALSVLGAGINESTYLLDGTDITSPRYGIARPSPGVEIMPNLLRSSGSRAE